MKSIETPPRVELLVDLPTVAVHRLNGRARDAVEGRHRLVVAFVTVDASARAVAATLRDAADALEEIES